MSTLVRKKLQRHEWRPVRGDWPGASQHTDLNGCGFKFRARFSLDGRWVYLDLCVTRMQAVEMKRAAEALPLAQRRALAALRAEERRRLLARLSA